MINYTVCGSLLAIVVLILIFALFMSFTLPKKMFAGKVDGDTSKIVHPPSPDQNSLNYPGYVSLIYINVKNIQDCIRYVEKNKTANGLQCLRFLYFFRIWWIRRNKLAKLPGDIDKRLDAIRGMSHDRKPGLVKVKTEFDELHHAIQLNNMENSDQTFNIDNVNLGGVSINILKPGEVAGNSYKKDRWGYYGDESSGAVFYKGKDSLMGEIDHCPELHGHGELQPLRDFVIKNGDAAGTVRCLYIYIGRCGGLGLTEDMFHGLTRYKLKYNNFPGTEVYMGSELGDISDAPQVKLDRQWPRNSGGDSPCGSLSSNDMAETIVGVNSDARYDAVFEYVRLSVSNYIKAGGNFTVPNILNSPTWAGLAEVLNLEPLKCRALTSNERSTCFPPPQRTAATDESEG